MASLAVHLSPTTATQTLVPGSRRRASSADSSYRLNPAYLASVRKEKSKKHVTDEVEPPSANDSWHAAAAESTHALNSTGDMAHFDMGADT